MKQEIVTTQSLGNLDGIKSDLPKDDEEDENEVEGLYKIISEKLNGNNTRKFYIEEENIIIHYPFDYLIQENSINFKSDWQEGGICYDFLKEFYNSEVKIISEETINGNCKYGTYGYYEIIVKV